MAYDLELGKRLSKACEKFPKLQTKKMFGGICYLLDGKICVGIHKDMLIVRVGPQHAEGLLKKPHVLPFDITGKAMKGWAMIEPAGLKSDATLNKYIKMAKDFVEIL